MKRFAVLAALMVALLAIPAAAMASSGSGSSVSGGPGYAPPRAVQAVCPVPFRLRKGHLKRVYIKGKVVSFKGKRPPKALLRLLRHGKKGRVEIVCRFRPGPPLCLGPIVRFDVASGSSNLTEVSGPILWPSQTFVYRGGTYTIMSVNPGANSFTVFHDNILFVNHGAAITNGVGFMACGH
ncbi:MAG: hypothetical protein ACRDPY_27005 [Streptosporangiaceae bacterium]